MAAGMNPMDLKRGIDLAAAAVVKDIERRARLSALNRSQPGPPPVLFWPKRKSLRIL